MCDQMDEGHVPIDREVFASARVIGAAKVSRVFLGKRFLRKGSEEFTFMLTALRDRYYVKGEIHIHTDIFQNAPVMDLSRGGQT
jgi:hypothetical protein